MDKERVALLISSIKASLSTKEDPKILNIFDLFELLEHVARNSMQDITPVTSCMPVEQPNLLHERPNYDNCKAVLDQEKVEDAIVDEGFTYD